MRFDFYFDESTNEVISYEQFIAKAQAYIDGCKQEVKQGLREADNLPTIAEVMLNMDDVIGIEQEEKHEVYAPFKSENPFIASDWME